MHQDNPAKTQGFAFLEFSTQHPDTLIAQWHSMGFHAASKHRHHAVTGYRQGDIRYFLNQTNQSAASLFRDTHEGGVSAMGFRVANAAEAFKYVVSQGAKPYQPENQTTVYDYPAIHGIGGTLIYLVDDELERQHDQHHFQAITPTTTPSSAGLTYIDHVTHNLYRGHMDEWADFYTRLFNFHEVRYFDIEGRATGLKSRAMTSPCGQIRIPLNESSDDQSQIEEFLRDFHGEGIQHIALGTNNIYESVKQLRDNNIQFLDTPATYYELLDQRLPNHGENAEKLKELSILLDGTTNGEKRLLLQIFTNTMIGPVFFEIIQRKGDDGFGEGNFRALFESIELDQIRRGVIKVEDGNL